MKYFLGIISGFFLVTFTFTNVGCNKNTDCKASITVVDSTGKALSNVKVKLFANIKAGNPPTTYVADVKAEGVTDAGGAVKFTFKLPAIFDISATKVITSPTRTLNGLGIIKLEEGKNTSKEVTVK
jgi:hypothetical protein